MAFEYFGEIEGFPHLRKVTIEGLPYLRAIELNIRDAFPGRKVIVWCENAMFNPGMIAIKARVDDAGAYTTLDFERGASEAEIADILIAMLKEVLE